MKADIFIKLLRKVVREEVQAVVREELGVLLETPPPQPVMVENKSQPHNNSMVESIKKTKPQKPLSFTNNNVLNDILNETANGGEWRSIIDATSQMAPNFGPIAGTYDTPEVNVVNSVDQMLLSAKPSSDINSVKIDTVPDFSNLMKTMKEKGQI
jgi:hypothetical protein